MDFAGFWGGGVSTILIGLSTILLGRSTILIGLSTVCPWFVHGQFGFQFFSKKINDSSFFSRDQGTRKGRVKSHGNWYNKH